MAEIILMLLLLICTGIATYQSAKENKAFSQTKQKGVKNGTSKRISVG